MEGLDELERRFFADESKVVPKHDIMKDFNLLKAFLSVEIKKSPDGHNRPNEHWAILFGHYNSNRMIGMPSLGMGCQPCYSKVYSFVRNYLLQKCLAATRP